MARTLTGRTLAAVKRKAKRVLTAAQRKSTPASKIRKKYHHVRKQKRKGKCILVCPDDQWGPIFKRLYINGAERRVARNRRKNKKRKIKKFLNNEW